MDRDESVDNIDGGIIDGDPEGGARRAVIVAREQSPVGLSTIA
jgi:hypothetical protein